MTTATVQIVPKMIPMFTAPNKRYRIARGGRGSGKSYGFEKMVAVKGMMLAQAGESGVILCGREFMNSLEESSMAGIKAAIASEPWLADFYDVGEKYIRTKCRRISFVFSGLSRNLDAVKSKYRVLLAFIEEAENVSEVAWRKLIPTVFRNPGAEIWAAYNPESEESAVHKRFVVNPSDDAIVVDVNYLDNPWFSEEMEAERLYDQKYNPDFYDHIWLGELLTLSDAQVLNGKWRVGELKVNDTWSVCQGIDFGFSKDPFTANRYWYRDNVLYCEYEVHKVGLELNDTPAFVKDAIPGFEDYVTRADSAEPKSISYLKNHGLPKIEGVQKWPGSVTEGVRWLRSLKEIVIHPRCTHTVKECKMYSHKVDKNTEEILPDIIDAWNHHIDNMRYACAPMIRSITQKKIAIPTMIGLDAGL